MDNRGLPFLAFMCAIVGHLNRWNAVDPEVFTRMRDSMRHRGPDGAGTEFRLDGRVALGHRRLAIVDPSERAGQPMTSEDGTVWLVFNGEIYNFKELRLELEALGHRFRSEADSEVLIHGYESWGRDILDRLDGMFAFALWDESAQTLLLARDRIGIKPLYYLLEEDRILFASELKGLVADPSVPREIDWEAAADFFVHRFIPHPRSIWKGIRKLPPGHSLEYCHRSGQSNCRPYWQLGLAEGELPEKEAVEKCRHLLASSVEKHLIGDVPIGLFLSGGYDSSALMLMMSELGEPIRSFALGFSDSEKSEHLLAREVAESFGAHHRERVVGAELRDPDARLAFHFDEPLGGTSLLPTYLLSELAGGHVKVVLAGDGGDEVFAGYNWHRELYDRFHPRGWKQRIKGLLGSGKDNDLARVYHQLTSWTGWSYRDLPKILDPALVRPVAGRDDAWIYRERLPVEATSPIKAFQALDFQTLLSEVFLAKVDRASMAHSLEVRVPFLNHRLVEFTAGLDESVYFRRDCTKFLLHRILENRVPGSVMDHPKQGFSVPGSHLMSGTDMERCLRDGRLVREGILQPRAVESLRNPNFAIRLWALCLFEWWFAEWAGG